MKKNAHGFNTLYHIPQEDVRDCFENRSEGYDLTGEDAEYVRINNQNLMDFADYDSWGYDPENDTFSVLESFGFENLLNGDTLSMVLEGDLTYLDDYKQLIENNQDPFEGLGNIECAIYENISPQEALEAFNNDKKRNKLILFKNTPVRDIYNEYSLQLGL